MDYIAPELASEAELSLVGTLLDKDDWILEQKLDGNRIMVVSPGGDYPPTVLTRNGNPYTKKVPMAVRNFRFGDTTHGFIPAGELVFDGELIRNGSDDYTFWVFDLPVFQGESELTLDQRRKGLEYLFDTGAIPFRLVPQAKTRDEKLTLVERALTGNFEGLVAKRAASKYVYGARNGDWLKLKFTTTADVVVTGVRDDGKDSIAYEVYDDVTGVPVDLGRASLIGKEKAAVINEGDVLEVRYLYVGANGRLYQPTILRKRDDKAASECTTAQLKWVNKAVLETL